MHDTRRTFLKLAVAGVNALMAAMLGIPVVGNILSPLFRVQAKQWVRVGPVAGFSPEAPNAARIQYEVGSGTRKMTRRETVWVVADAGSPEPIAFSSECTHAACSVGWSRDEKLFLCPCHGGKFAPTGEVVAGPPPEPMRRLPARVENGDLFVEV